MHMPGPLSYHPNIKQIKPRASAATCKSGTKRMNFQMPGTVTPSPFEYQSQNSDSIRDGFRSSSAKKINEFSQSWNSLAKNSHSKNQFAQSIKSELATNLETTSKGFSQSIIDTRVKNKDFQTLIEGK